jgi:peptidoglycan/LPS O-acetylase OafA/YrhL
MVYLFSAYTALIGWCIGPEFYDKLLNPPSTNHYNVLRVGIGLLVLPVIYGISAFFYRFVERPGIAFGKKLLPKTKLTT